MTRNCWHVVWIPNLNFKSFFHHSINSCLQKCHLFALSKKQSQRSVLIPFLSRPSQRWNDGLHLSAVIESPLNKFVLKLSKISASLKDLSMVFDFLLSPLDKKCAWCFSFRYTTPRQTETRVIIRGIMYCMLFPSPESIDCLMALGHVQFARTNRSAIYRPLLLTNVSWKWARSSGQNDESQSTIDNLLLRSLINEPVYV